MVLSLVHIPNSILVMIKKTKLIFYISLIGALVNIILNYFLISNFGIIGGAIATSFSLILIFILTFISSYKLTKIQPLKLNYFKSILSGIISFFTVFFIINLINKEVLFISFILFSILFLIIYFLLLYLLRGFDKGDRDIMRSFYIKLKKIKLF